MCVQIQEHKRKMNEKLLPQSEARGRGVETYIPFTGWKGRVANVPKCIVGIQLVLLLLGIIYVLSSTSDSGTFRVFAGSGIVSPQMSVIEILSVIIWMLLFPAFMIDSLSGYFVISNKS